MVKIRLRRMGAKKNPFYRVVVADSRSPRDGRFIEEIGTYNPLSSPSEIVIDVERADYWIKNGAQPTDTVRALLKKANVVKSDDPPANVSKKQESDAEKPEDDTKVPEDNTKEPESDAKKPESDAKEPESEKKASASTSKAKTTKSKKEETSDE